MAEQQRQRRAKGRGTVYQRADGMWMAKVELPRDIRTGARRQKVVSSKDQKVVEDKLDDLRAELKRSGDLPTATMRLAAWMDFWFANIDQSKPRTRESYRSKIEQYIKPAIGHVKLDQLNVNDVRRLEQHIVKAKGLSSTTALQAYQILAVALRDAEREGRVVRNVARLVRPPRKAASTAKVLDAEQGIAVLESVVDERLGSRWAAALLTGARQGELLGLELDRVGDHLELAWQLQRIAWAHGCGDPTGSDDAGKATYPCGRRRAGDCPKRRLDAPADWEHRHLTGALYLSRPKSKAGWRVIPLVDPLRSIIERRVEHAAAEPNPHGLLWTAEPKRSQSTHQLQGLDGKPIDPSKDNAAWHAVLERAGVPQVRLHDARHTAVTLLSAAGVPIEVIQDIVGQSTVAVTMSYRHRTSAPMAEALTRLGKVLER